MADHPELSEEVMYQIKKELKEINMAGHKTGRRVNCKEKWNKISLYSHISASFVNDFKQKSTKKSTC